VRESKQRSALAPFAYYVALAIGEQDLARTFTGEMHAFRSLAEAGAFARWAEGRRGDAIAILQQLARKGHSTEQAMWSYQLARWALEEKRPDTAIEFLEWMPRVLTAPGAIIYNDHTGEDDAFSAPKFLLLGKAYEMRGDPRRARDAYSRFLDLWRDADADAPGLTEARTRLAALTDRR
jgi:tetratricopeptide (TPR) repeat protein